MLLKRFQTWLFCGLTLLSANQLAQAQVPGGAFQGDPTSRRQEAGSRSMRLLFMEGAVPDPSAQTPLDFERRPVGSAPSAQTPLDFERRPVGSAIVDRIPKLNTSAITPPLSQPFAPSGVADEHNYQPFERYDSSNYGRGAKANEGYFFQYDRLIWAMTGPKKTDIGDAASAGIIDNGGGLVFLNLNSLDTGFIKTDWDWGNRYELGYMTKDDGWLVSVFHVHEATSVIQTRNVNIAFSDPLGINSQFVDFNGDGIQDDINGNMVFGNNSPNNVDTSMPLDGTLDAYVGPDFGDLLSLPVTFSSFAAVNRTSLWNIEVMRMMRWNPLHYGGNFEWMYGLRYLQISDNFDLSAAAGQGIFTSFAVNSDVRNQILGPQIGMRWNCKNQRWTLNFEARFMPGINFQQAELQGLTTGGGGQLQAGSVNAFRDSVSDTVFAPTGELRLETAYQLTKAVSLRMGYTGMIVGGTTKASRRIAYNLPEPFLNTDNLREAFIANGFNLGVEINR